LVKGSGGVGAGEGERCPCKVALMEWAPCHANPQNNAVGASGVVRFTHCVPYSDGAMHGRDMEALNVSMCCTVASLFMTTKGMESRGAGKRAPSSATRESRPDPVSLVGSEPTDAVIYLL
jgi:hypothetical protein